VANYEKIFKMTAQNVKRKLTAILSADVEGYSRLMGEDEAATIRTLTEYKKTMTELITQHRGRVVDSPGDNLLAEFASVVDAVNCAVEIQRELAERNQELPSERRMQFRIGVNLGDVVEEEDRIYGDGVNIAARLESLAEGGGICISRNAYDEVKSKLDLEYEHLGEQEVKNIAEPVRAYRLLSYPGAAAHRVVKAKKRISKQWLKAAFGLAAVLVIAIGAAVVWNYFISSTPDLEPASVEKMAFPLPEKPSIAVLPFDNLSGNPDQEYIADGITENIITGLSQIPDMFVIARSSVFTYKGKPVKMKKVSEELGVRYVLEGSVQRTEDRLRVTAQLIDALKGHHLWAERYDRELKDMFALQDEITIKILNALEVKLAVGEVANWYRTDNFEAWSLLTKGFSLLNRVTMEDLFKARKHFEQAANLEPDYAPAWTMLAWTYTIEAMMGWSKSSGKSIKRSFDLAQKAAALGEDQARLHSLMNRIYRVQGKFDKAIAEGKKAVALIPNSARFHIFLAESLHYGGRPEEAISHARKAMRLEPYYPAWFLFHFAGPYEMVGRYEEANAIWKQQLERALKGEFPPIYVHERLVINYARLDRMEEARAHAAEILKIQSDYTVEFYRSTTRYKDKAYLENQVALLRKAGLPEHPPLELPDKPSIAVLPFDNMSDDPEQEYFGDGLAEDIITALSKVPKIFVIARNSAFTYKGKAVKIQQIGRELGVKYVLEGSVRKAGNRIRITAQLIEAATEHHLWAERYDRDLKDIFALQDEITMKIITALRVQLMEGEHARASSKGTKNLEAYLKLLQARELSWRFNKNDNALARQMLKEAIALDADYANAYVWLAGIHLNDVLLGSTKSPKQSFSQAIELAQKALTLDDSLSNAHSLLALLYALSGHYDKAIAEGERGVELGPNDEAAHRRLGVAYSHVGRYDEAILLYKKAIRFNPFPRSATLFQLGIAYLFTGRCEEAIAACKKAVQGRPDDLVAHVFLTAVYGSCGREAQARAAATEVLRIDPQFSVDYYARQFKFKKQEDKKLLFDGLRKAGLK
jgi:TolB-like protein/class 3 adenylate cyclase/Flp pilus assembly protein TadD